MHHPEVSQPNDALSLEALYRGRGADSGGAGSNEVLAQSPIIAGYESTTGIDFSVNPAIARATITPKFSGKFKVRVFGSILNNDATPQNLEVVLSHDNGSVDPIAPDTNSGVTVAGPSASAPFSYAFDYTTTSGAPFPLGTPVRFNVGAIVGDPAHGFNIFGHAIQLTVEELPES